jgi:hypothetical protein
MTVGGAVDNASGGPGGTEGAFHVGARGDLLFFRNRGADMALGPYVDAATAGLHHLDVGGGIEWLAPLVKDELPFVLSAGPFWRNGDGHSWSPGVEATLFFGSRSYNFHSWYGLAAGAFAQTRWLPLPPSALDVVFGVQIDVELLLLPALFVYEAVAH